MDNNKKKPTLREAYDAARKGEAYGRRLKDAKQAVNVVEAKVLLSGSAVSLGYMFIARLILPDGARALVALAAAIVVIVVIVGTAMLIWRMHRGNIFAKVYEDLNNQLADPDGVKRTTEERVFLAGPFGTTAMFLCDTAKLVQHANANYYDVARTVSSTDDPDFVEVGNTLSRVSDRFGKLEVLLETRWNECPPSVRDAPFTRDCLRDICQQLTVINIQTIDCYSFIYRYLP